MKSFISLTVWQKSHALVLEIYQATQSFVAEERFGITLQIRRAVVSIAANIAEGSRRNTDRDFAHFVSIAQGSLEEVKYYILLSRDLGYLTELLFQQLMSHAEAVSKMLYRFYRRLKVDSCHSTLNT